MKKVVEAILGINYGTLLSRLDESKWSVEKVFETPVKEGKVSV